MRASTWKGTCMQWLWATSLESPVQEAQYTYSSVMIFREDNLLFLFLYSWACLCIVSSSFFLFALQGGAIRASIFYQTLAWLCEKATCDGSCEWGRDCPWIVVWSSSRRHIVSSGAVACCGMFRRKYRWFRRCIRWLHACLDWWSPGRAWCHMPIL